MKIDEIINIKYYDLANLCKKNIIKRIEITDSSSFKDIEEIDLLHTMIIKWLRTKKDIEFDLEIGYQQIRKEFLGEKNIYSKITKPNTLSFIELVLKDEIDKSDLKDI